MARDRDRPRRGGVPPASTYANSPWPCHACQLPFDTAAARFAHDVAQHPEHARTDDTDDEE